MNQTMIQGAVVIVTMMLMPITQPIDAAISGIMVYLVYQLVNTIGNVWIFKRFHN